MKIRNKALESQSEIPVLYVLTQAPATLSSINVKTGEVQVITTFGSDSPDGIILLSEKNEAVVSFMGESDTPYIQGEKEPTFFKKNGSLQKISLSNGYSRMLLKPGSFTTGKQITRDRKTGRLYWCDREGRTIYRCEQDGSNQIKLIENKERAFDKEIDWPVGIALDNEQNFLYWTQKGPAKGGQGRIFRAGIEIPEGENFSNRTDIEILWENLPEPIDLELDLGSNMIYWTDRGKEPTGNTLNRAPIPEFNKTGESQQILAHGFQEAIGLAINSEDAIVYVSDLSGKIRSVNLRTGVVSIVAELPGLATGIALEFLRTKRQDN